MRILGIATTYAPLHGGAETCCRTLFEGLAAKGHDVHLVTHAHDFRTPITNVFHGVTIHRTRNFVRLINKPNGVAWEESFFGPLTDLAEELKSLQFDLIHTQNQAALLLGSYFKHFFNCPLIASFHETNPEQDPFGVARSETLFRSLPYDGIIAGSRFFEAQALRFGAPHQKVFMVHHGIHAVMRTLEPDRASLRSKLGIPPKVFMILALARFKPRKRQLALLRTVAGMVAEGVPIYVCLAGSRNGASQEYLLSVREAAANPLLRGHVAIFEDPSDEDINCLLDCADVGAMISEAEGLGIALLEYMSHGLPVIARNIPGLSEVVKHQSNGILLETTSDEELRKALLELNGDANLRLKLGGAGRMTVMQEFSADRMITQTLSIYNKVLRSHKV